MQQVCRASNRPVRITVNTAVLPVLLAMTQGVAWAQSGSQAYPVRPIRLIVASSPSSGVDIVARVVAQKLGERLANQVVVDNRAGAGGNLGAEIAAHATADGYTLFMATPAHAINSSLASKPTYDLLRDFVPVTQATTGMYVLIVNPGLPARTVNELVGLAKSKPGALNYGSGGPGNSTHLAVELFAAMAGVRLTHVPYRGSGPALVDLLAGQIQLMVANLTAALPHVRSGKLRALGVTGSNRSAAVPEIPTVAEAGVPGYEVTSWFGVVAPGRSPREIVSQLAREMSVSLKSADVREKLASDAAEAVGGTPEQFGAFLKAETAKWAEVVRRTGLAANDHRDPR
jgi:tripartite-type tricarboxylate transporter receptor subunit TctC